MERVKKSDLKIESFFVVRQFWLSDRVKQTADLSEATNIFITHLIAAIASGAGFAGALTHARRSGGA